MSEENKSTNFIHNIIDEDLKNGKYGDKVYTRFPPEPNGYLHIGHAKSICLNFSTAIKYNGKCNLRYDDTNPVKEDVEYVKSIEEDVKWLGFQWDERLWASDYFEKMYDSAVILIKKGKAYVDDLSQDEIRNLRGTLTSPGKNSPYRDRRVEENLRLFEEMKDGKYENGAKVLRAKIDMSSPNINMRDPVIYRISHNSHHPEHYENGIDDFTLADLVEMFFDWKAASERHNDGDVLKSIEINKQRFGLSEQLCKIFENTERWLCIKNTINQKE